MHQLFHFKFHSRTSSKALKIKKKYHRKKQFYFKKDNLIMLCPRIILKDISFFLSSSVYAMKMSKSLFSHSA